MPDNQITGNIGLYYVCLELSKKGFNVMPTARNAKGIDVIAYNKTGKRFVGFQVKALTKPNPVPLGANTEALMGDFWVIVSNLKAPKFLIMSPSEVAARAVRRQKGDKVSCWLERRAYEIEEFENR